jgi:glycogen debranching enzyme
MTCDDNDLIYYGSTKLPLEKRLKLHKSNYMRFLNNTYHYCTSFELCGSGNVKIEKIEECYDYHNAIDRESYYIRNFKCVNQVIPNRTPEEYAYDSREKITKRKKEYYKENRDKILLRKKEKIKCDVCEIEISRTHNSRHKKSYKHINNLKNRQ